MSALGQKQTLGRALDMSALHPKADIGAPRGRILDQGVPAQQGRDGVARTADD